MKIGGKSKIQQNDEKSTFFTHLYKIQKQYVKKSAQTSIIL